ncbi:MAG TPA: YegS/Rv2252/BmrU family lipid kinase [Chitinophagaceae bacterium]|nr:YegS/Rv2252/BmrU family lipid kinase [Chitinophagaceae bacterium]
MGVLKSLPLSRRFVYIVNPVSGTRNKGLLRQKIETFATSAGFPFHIFPSVADGDYTFLKIHIAETGVTDVVIAGGDGTINGVLAGLQQVDVQFGLLPCGSGNGLAFSTGLSKNIDQALQIILAGKSAPTDAFLINNQYACMLCGLGFDAQVAHAFAADPARGLNTYIKKSVQHFFSAKAYPFTLHIQNRMLQTEAFLISIANSNQFGNNVTIAPKASLTDGLLDVVIVTKQNKLALIWETLKQVGGYNPVQDVKAIDKKAGVLYLQTAGLKIENPAGAPMHLDGDPIQTTSTINVQLLKENFRLIYP